MSGFLFFVGGWGGGEAAQGITLSLQHSKQTEYEQLSYAQGFRPRLWGPHVVLCKSFD